MSNDLLNWRFGSYHIHVMRDRPWIKLGRNPYHDDPAVRSDPSWKWFERY